MSQSSMRKLIGWKFLENRWALVPVVMLSCTVIGATAMVTLALGDGSATAAEPDYYRKGAAWDEMKRQIAENGALGWIVTPSIVAGRKDPRSARLELTIADKYGVKIEGAVVTTEMFPIRAADSRIQLALSPGGAGRYGIDVPIRINGQWEIRVTIEANGKIYSDRFRRHIAFVAPSALGVTSSAKAFDQ